MAAPGAFALMLMLALPASAATIASHAGSADPATEGWDVTMVGSGSVSSGPVDDGGTPAWSVADDTDSVLFYSQEVSNAEVDEGDLFGWVLSVRLRVPSSDVTDAGSVVAAYRDGARSWQMFFGHDDDGDTVVKLFTENVTPIQGPTHTVPGNDAYHDYALVYDPVAMSADLFVNGSEVLSDYEGLPGIEVGFSREVLWGTGRTVVAGEGRFNAVALTVPEPATALLVLAAGVVLGRRRPGSPGSGDGSPGLQGVRVARAPGRRSSRTSRAEC